MGIVYTGLVGAKHGPELTHKARGRVGWKRGHRRGGREVSRGGVEVSTVSEHAGLAGAQHSPASR